MSGLLGDIPKDAERNWQGMPGYNHRNLEPHSSIKVNFRNTEDRKKFEEFMEQRANSQGSMWYPKAEIGKISDKRYSAETPVNPQYPIYIISKGRWKSPLTIKALRRIRVPYRVVIEPQEYDQYTAVVNPKRILTLPFSNLGQGSIPARNWVWERSLKRGDERHWILDDNIGGFYRFQENLKVPVSDGTIFRAAEDFSDRYKNVAISGLNYFMFVKRKYIVPPYILNTRIYSCILINNSIPFRWRGRYNEDTDLSIRVLKAGWSTILFNAFLAEKKTTMTMKGGNTDELYAGDGRRKMAESLKEQHPTLVKITKKWGRWQHSVNYRIFRKNRLVPNPEYKPADGVDNYEMELRFVGEE